MKSNNPPLPVGLSGLQEEKHKLQLYLCAFKSLMGAIKTVEARTPVEFLYQRYIVRTQLDHFFFFEKVESNLCISPKKKKGNQETN